MMMKMRMSLRCACTAAAVMLAAVSLTGCSLTKIEPNGRPEEPEAGPEAVQSVTQSVGESVPEVVSIVESVESTAEEAESAASSVVTYVVESIAEVPAEVESVVEAPAGVLPESELRVLGSAQEVTEYVSKTRLGNASDKEIISLDIRLKSDGYDTVSYLNVDDAWAPSERLVLYFNGEKGLKEAKQYGDIAEFQVTVTYEDGLVWRLAKFPFSKTDEVTIMRGDNYAYMIYTNQEDSSVVNTENRERGKLGLDEVEIVNEDPAANYPA